MARNGFYPRPYLVCDGSGATWFRTDDGPEWTACGGCAACAPPTGDRLAAAQARGSAGALQAMAGGPELDDDAF